MAKHRSKKQIVRDRRRVAELYLTGKYQEDIADELSLSRATVSRDLRPIVDQWQAEAVGDIKRKKMTLRRRQKLMKNQCIILIWREMLLLAT